MEKIGKILSAVNKAVEYIVSVLLAIMVVVVFLQVIFRFIIKSSLPWSEELSRYILVWISFLGTSIGIKRKGHIGVEAVINYLPFTAKNIVAVIAHALSSVLFGVLIIWGYQLIGKVVNQTSPAMEISMAIPYSAVFTGGILMLLYSIYNIMLTARAIRRGDN